MTLSLRFDRGTLRLDGPVPHHDDFRQVIWDDRTRCWRAPAFRYREIRRSLRERRVSLTDHLCAAMLERAGPWQMPGLRSYQQQALEAWQLHERRGVVVLPTGAGKTRVAIAAMAGLAKPSLVLVPTRALLAQWSGQLRDWYGGELGIVGDGERSAGPVTVMTFASAYRQMDRLGARFCLLVVDEVHHYGGSKAEALEMCAAPLRLGLTATAPKAESLSAFQIDRLVGPVVHRVAMQDLLGSHLAELEVQPMRVRLDDEELRAYLELEAPFAELRRAYFRANPNADFASMVRAVSRLPDGRRALANHHRACAIASFPKEKRSLVKVLLARHRHEKCLVFTALADDAYTVSYDNLIPIITADIGRAEREEILQSFREGRVRAIVSARVLNEGLDVPDARVGIVVAGAQGAREHVQRVGRVLRPSPGKTALVYELITVGTLDHDRAESRWRSHAA